LRSTRLSALDASFLEVETPAAHMHVGWVAHFSGCDDRPLPGFEELREHIAGRLDVAPRFRQRLASVPLGIHAPEWADDPDFRVENHVLRARFSDVRAVADEVMSRPLARDRPLWEMWITEDGEGFTVVGKAHHCMVDGLAALELGMALLDVDPDAPRDRSAPRETRPAPAALPLVARAVADRLGQQLDVARAGLALARSPKRLLRTPAEVTRVGRAMAHAIVPFAPASSLNRPSSPLRHLARMSRPLDDLRRIKTRHRTTINDVLLAAVAGGLRGFFAERGDAAVDLKSMVPVNVRDADADAAGALGNRIAFLFTELPCAEPDPVRRLRKVNAVTAQRKAAHEAEGSDAALRALAHGPRALQRVASHLVASPFVFNLVVSNIPGPPQPLYLLGCELTRAYPVVPLAAGHALSVGMTTVQHEACLGLYADRQALPDVDRLARHLDNAIDELLDLS
jgi:diacylglycerol O-acyltransferase